MEYIVIAFRSRAHTVKFYELLSKSGVYCEIISTPKEAGVGCGLSVKISPNSLFTAKAFIRKSAFTSFAGLFKVKESLGVRLIKGIN